MTTVATRTHVTRQASVSTRTQVDVAHPISCHLAGRIQKVSLQCYCHRSADNCITPLLQVLLAAPFVADPDKTGPVSLQQDHWPSCEILRASLLRDNTTHWHTNWQYSSKAVHATVVAKLRQAVAHLKGDLPMCLAQIHHAHCGKSAAQW